MTSPLQDQLQRTLGDAYVIERELGGGGMSRVFLAREIALGRRVVIKLLPPDLVGVVSVERFRREIQLAASLQHPHLVPVLTSGATEGLPYFTMPFQAGESLRERIAREGPLPVRDVLSILRDVTQALAYAHANGVIHRDIKPDNILLTGGVAMVTDFGVAKAIGASGSGSAITSVGFALGTPAYMAPEQGTADPESDQRADLYALGAVAYEMLCGTTLFPGRSPQQVLVAHAVETPKPVRESRHDVPPALSDLIVRLLAKDPAQRPANARAVLAELEAMMTGAGAARSAAPLARTVAVAAGVVAAGALIAWGAFALAGRRPAISVKESERSIAVLPFQNTSGDQENEYFGDGMAEELMTALNKVPGLRVAARTSAFAFKGKTDDIREIGRKLNVGTVLEGSVRRSGKRLRVSARLVDATNGYNVWSDEYERDETDVFKVQDELTNAIVTALQLHLTPGGGAEISKRGTANLEAYNLYLQARFFYEKRSEEGLVKAAQYFEGAIKLDSNYAAAYAGLAESYGLLGSFGFRAPADMYPKAKPAALRALALDSTLAEAHTALGFINLFYDFDYNAGKHELGDAITLNPQYAPARLFRSWYYLAAGDPEEAVREIERAREIDPLSMIINTRAGTFLFFAKRYDSARVQLLRTLELDPGNPLAHMQLSRAYLGLRKCRDALDEAVKGGTGVVNYEGANLGFAAVSCGDSALARRELQRLLALAGRQYVPADVVARLYAGLGEKAKALDWLDRAYRQDTWSLILLKVEPMYDNLRSEPRFQALVKKMRLQ